VSCSDDENCVNGICESSLCAGVVCAPGNSCQQGRCVSGLCIGVSCGAGNICVLGRCQPSDCAAKTCDPGHACFSDQCVDAACWGVACPAGSTCQQGACTAIGSDAGVPFLPPAYTRGFASASSVGAEVQDCPEFTSAGVLGDSTGSGVSIIYMTGGTYRNFGGVTAGLTR
jgi:hypothetical protein